MPDHGWMKEALMVILTMRDEDAATWDPEQLVRFAGSFSADTVGYSSAGVTAFYPTEVPFHRRAAGLGGRDLVGDTLQAARRRGMRVLGRIDVSIGAKDVFLARPEWFAVDPDGRPIDVHGFYVACPNAGYYREFGPAIVRELLTRYDFDGLWANAAQFSAWHTPQCHCPACQRRFKAETGERLPREDWRDPLWLKYNEWRYRCVAEWCALIDEVKREVRPECAWLPLSQVAESWDHIRRGGWDIDYTERHADGIVLEAQRRYTNMWWPGLEARYARGLDPDKPCAIGCSYFLPWWRFYAVPAPENQIWIGQVIANGGRPQLHHSGYLSDHYDRRGMEPVRALLGRVKANLDAYNGLASRSRVALVYSRHTFDNFAGPDPENLYLDHFRGFYNAMLEARLPFDVLSDKRLTADLLAKYDAVALPNLACLSDQAADALLAYVEAGGHVVATYKTGFFNETGRERTASPILELCGGAYTGVTLEDLKAAYGEIRDPEHPLLAGMGDTDIVPVGGNVCMIAGPARGKAPLTFIPAVESQPGSGISVPEHNRIEFTTDAPLVLEGRKGQGRAVFFPWEPDRLAYRLGLPDHFRLLAAALRRAPRWQDLVTVEGAGLLDVSVMATEDRLAVHLVNLSAPGSFNSGHRRTMAQIVPLHDLKVSVLLPEGTVSVEARLVHAGRTLEPVLESGRVELRVPVLNEFETVLLRLR